MSQPVFGYDDNGNIVPIAPQDAATYAAQGRLASAEEMHQQQLEEKYGGIGGGLKAAGLGALRGATLGLSDLVASKLGGDETKEAIKGYQEANPWISGGAELAGGIAPGLLTGGASEVGEAANVARLAGEGVEAAEGASALGTAGSALKTAGKVIGAPSNAASFLGENVEKGIAAVLGGPEGKSFITRLATQAVTHGANAATQGALIGLGNEISEESLGDADLNGEKLLASGLHGALLGFAGGAGLSAAGEIGGAVLGKIAPKLQTMAEEQAFRSINPRKLFTTEAERIPGGAQGVGRRLLDEGLVKPGDRVEDVAERLGEARTKAGEQIGQILETADAHGFEGPSLKAIRAEVERRVMPDLRVLESTNQGAIAKVEGFMRDLETHAGVPSVESAAAQGIDRATVLDNARLTFKQAQDFRARIDDTINWNTESKAGQNAAKSFRGIMENEIEQSGDRAAKQLGKNFLEDYQEAKLRYRQISVADKAAQDAVKRELANRVASPSDMMAGVAGMLHGGGGEHAAGGLLGLAMGGLHGLAAGAIHHVIRERGNSTAAVLLDKLSALRGVERATNAVSTNIDRGIAGFLGEGERAPIRVREPAADAHAYRTAAHDAMARPEAHSRAIEEAAAPIAAHAPATVAALKQAAMRATAYLSQQAPKSHTQPSVTPQFDKPRLSPTDEHKYATIAHVVHDPMSVLRDMSTGKVTRAQVDALKANYPQLYAKEIVPKMQAKLATLKKPLSYDQKKSLAVLFGADVKPDATFDPDFMRTMQSHYAPEGGPPAGGPAPKSRGGSAPKRKLSDASRSLEMPGNR